MSQNGKGSTDHRYGGRTKIMVPPLTASEAGWLIQREEIRAKYGEDLAIEFERETCRRQGVCPDCGKSLVTVVGGKDMDWPRMLNGHFCDPPKET